MDRNTQLTHSFKLSEFVRAQDPLPSPEIIQNLYRLANRLQVIRDLIGKPIRITSGYRTPEHNKKVGGEPNSYHLKGMAADIVIDGVAPGTVQNYLKNWSGGLGAYPDFTHCDIGPTRRWGNFG